jgi:glycosyltransferase involved in cell wall biosynthesis
MTRSAFVSTYGVPRPHRDSGSKRLFDLMRFLRARGWDLTFVAAAGIHDEVDARRLRRLGITVYDAELTSIELLAETAQFDIALFAFWQIAELMLPLFRAHSPKTRVVVDSVDAQFVRDARRAYRLGPSGGPTALLGSDYGDEIVGELNVYAAADCVLAVSQAEADLLGSLMNDHTLAHCVPDSEHSVTDRSGYEDRRGMLFVGSFDHPPNADAVRYACQEILPLVPEALRREHPLYVVGDSLDETVRAYAEGTDHVRLVGWVPALAPYYERARVVLVPLRYGAGTKRKVIQALMANVPMVATSIGAEGLHLEDERDFLLANDAPSFAAAIERLLEDRALWETLASVDADVIERHSEEAVADALFEALDDTLARDPKPPSLPRSTRKQLNRRILYQAAQKFVPEIERMLDEFVAPGATVVVANEGLLELLRLQGREALPLPHESRQTEKDMLAALEQAARAGAEVLVVPKVSLWWNERFNTLQASLGRRFAEIASTEVCDLYDLRRRPAGLRLRRADRREGSEVGEDAESVQLIAFYLPQFHPIPENDAWWGEGFTEWRNVASAEPLFEDHYQPRLPSNLGFYDLRLSETREAQADLARAHGITGFCYYHYWFSGKQLLERPFDEVLASGRPDFPFCLCWANEPWSRRWDGKEQDVLQPQSYSEEDDHRHIAWLLPALLDQRAIRVEGKPLFLVYQGRELPDAARTTEIWQAAARESGLPGLHLVTVETGWDAGWDATSVGFDAKVLFQPQFSILDTVPKLDLGPDATRVFDYQEAWKVLAHPDPVDYARYDCVCPSWDNTARRGDASWVLHNSSPEAYQAWLELALRRALDRPAAERLVFLNAWNEWAEGAYLEPDRRNGLAYLEATRRAREGVGAGGVTRRETVPA